MSRALIPMLAFMPLAACARQEKPISPAPAQGEAEFAAGQALFDERRYEEALAQFERAVQCDPKRPEYWHARGRAAGRIAEFAPLVSVSGPALKSIEGFEKTIELDPRNFAARRDALEFCMQTPVVMGGGRAKAEAQARAMESLSPADAHRAWGRIAMRAREFPKAEREMALAVEAKPNDAEIHADFGVVYQWEKKFPEAFAEFRKALAIDPQNAEARFRFGETAALSGLELDAGEAILRGYLAGKILGNDPSPAAARMSLGLILAAKGDKDAARAELAKAIELNPRLKGARKALEDLGR